VAVAGRPRVPPLPLPCLLGLAATAEVGRRRLVGAAVAAAAAALYPPPPLLSYSPEPPASL
jgi:hypothetical protein